MRVAFLTHEPFYPPSGGGSAAAVYLVRELVARGHQVEIFGPEIPDAAGVEARFGVRLRPFRAWRMGRTTPLRTPKYLAYPVALDRLVQRTIREEGTRFDVALAQHSISAVAAGRLKRRLGLPIVLNLLDCLTGFLETWPPYLMPRPVARALVRYELSLPRRTDANAVLTVSDSLRDRLVREGFPAARVLAAYYGYDAALFRCPPLGSPSPPPPSTSGTEAPLVVMHGSFDHHHLGVIARQAVRDIARARPEVRFRFLGPQTPALESFLRDVRRAVPRLLAEVTGFVPYAEIPPRLLEGTVGITPYEPSTGTHYAFVAKTVEYLALGLPVVSTPLESALRYYAGLSAVTFSGPRGEGFSRAVLEWLARSAVERRTLVEPARRKVEAELDWGVLCRRAVEFIEAQIQR